MNEFTKILAQQRQTQEKNGGKSTETPSIDGNKIEKFKFRTNGEKKQRVSRNSVVETTVAK